MAGPTFSLWFASFPPASCDLLRSIVAAVASGPRRHTTRPAGELFDAELFIEAPGAGCSGLIGLHVVQRDDRYPAFVQAAFRRDLGWIPEIELTGFCMVKQPADWAALRLLATRVVAGLGGWFIEQATDARLPSLPPGVSVLHPGVCEVVACDEAGYFGAMVSDRDYVSRHLANVPVERFWVIDARLEPVRSVGK